MGTEKPRVETQGVPKSTVYEKAMRVFSGTL